MLRDQKRFACSIETQVGCLSGTSEARISDLGTGGCRIDSEARVRTGETVSFYIPLPSGRSISLMGTVAYVREGEGFGVTFGELPMETKMQILNLMKASEG